MISLWMRIFFFVYNIYFHIQNKSYHIRDMINLCMRFIFRSECPSGPLYSCHYNHWLVYSLAGSFPTPNSTAPTFPRAFVSRWILRFEVLSTVTTDRGCQFESTLWKELMELLGSVLLRTTAYNPIANGIVERFHRQLKAGIHPNSTHCVDLLPIVLLDIRTALKTDLCSSVAD